MDKPAGRVTFLFTDIEGSTKLLHRLGDAYAEVLGEHRRLLRTAFEQHHGYEVDTQGDAFFVAFPDAIEAIEASVEGQRALAEHPWTPDGAVTVRMGLHTGYPRVSAEGYVGVDVHKGARIAAAAHGGQILVSASTGEELAARPIPGIGARDLGGYVLKDFTEPEQLFQILGEALRVDFAPLRTRRPTNLPADLTTFVGREQDVAGVAELLDRSRLVTLSGPGGSGKTRLALRVAGSMIDRFPAGVWLVDLTPLADPGLLEQTVASALGLQLEGGTAVDEALRSSIGEKSMLLVIDNCEHVLADTARIVGDLLRSCPALRVLATSRESLFVHGEHAWPVAPLAPPESADTIDDLLRNASVQLFCERAEAAAPRFRLDANNSAAVVRICRRLDGIPLAIELAAARVAMLDPNEIAARLDDRSGMLSGPAAHPRHRTLEAAMEWSHRLLAEDEQTVFRRLAASAGGYSLEAAEGICAAAPVEPAQILEVVGRLIAKSLVVVRTDAASTRYHMLETIRTYALDRLGAAGEELEVRRRHLDWFTRWAETAEEALRWGPPDGVWLARVESEHDNIRAALRTAAELGWPEIGLRLVVAMAEFWFKRGYVSEGRAWTDDALASAGEVGGELGVRLWARAGFLALLLGDYGPARERIDTALDRARPLSQALTVDCLNLAGWVHSELDEIAVARRTFEEGLALARELGHRGRLLDLLGNLANTLLSLGEPDAARALFKEKLDLDPERQDWRTFGALGGLAVAEAQRGGEEEARRHVTELVGIARRTGDRWVISSMLYWAAEVYTIIGNLDDAADAWTELLELALQRSDRSGVVEGLDALAGIAEQRGDLERAVRARAAAMAHRRQAGKGFPIQEHTEDVAGLRRTLGEAAFERAWQAGETHSIEEAIRDITTR